MQAKKIAFIYKINKIAIFCKIFAQIYAFLYISKSNFLFYFLKMKP